MARLRLQSVIDSCETAYDDTTHLPKGDESADAPVITALEVNAVYRALDGCGRFTPVGKRERSQPALVQVPLKSDARQCRGRAGHTGKKIMK